MKQRKLNLKNGLKSISKKILLVGPAMAKEFLVYNTFKSQRAIKDKWVTELVHIINGGLFTIGNITFAVLTYNRGKKLMANGQHCCKAIVLSGVAVECVIEEYKCSSPEALSMLYRQYDNVPPRTLAVNLAVEAGALSVGWGARIPSLVVGGACFNRGLGHLPKNKKVELLKDHLPEGEFVDYVLHYSLDGKIPFKDVRFLYRQPIVAIMMLTWGKNRKSAEKFWLAVRDGENLTRDMPAFKLREWLMRASDLKGVRYGTKPGQVLATNVELMHRCIVAWNAFRRGKTTKLAYCSAKKLPRVV